MSKNIGYYFVLPVVLVALSLGAFVAWGLKPGIDLAGGSLLRVTYPDGRPTVEEIHSSVADLELGEMRVQPAGESGYVVRARDLSIDEKSRLLDTLGQGGTVVEEEFSSVGPSIGAELMQKAWIAVGLVAALTILFIAFAFRRASRPSSWKYGVVAIVTLLHDIIIPVGLFAFLGYTVGAEVDSLFIVALLTILGISINDTIVVFDRIRENLALNEDNHRHEDFADTVGKSVRQTIARSINTSLTVVIVLVALYVWGPDATRNFALTLTVGMVAGTYSSIFLASPLLVVWERWSKKN